MSNSSLQAKSSTPAALLQLIGSEMLSRLAWVTLRPETILTIGMTEAGCGLQAVYPAATVVTLDHAYPRQKAGAGQAENSVFTLPFPDQSVDLICANLVLPWVSHREAVLREWRRVLRPEGVLLFSSLGPDTLQGLRAVLGEYVLPDGIDMHETGDALTRMRFADPVLDVDYLTLTYQAATQFWQEMQANAVLTDCCDQATFVAAALPRLENGRYAATFEVVYGHAFGPDAMVDQIADEDGVVRIPLAHLRRRS